jgi:hypothetical protein
VTAHADLSATPDDELDRLIAAGEEADQERKIRRDLALFAERPDVLADVRFRRDGHRDTGIGRMVVERFSWYRALARWEQGERR